MPFSGPFEITLQGDQNRDQQVRALMGRLLSEYGQGAFSPVYTAGQGMTGLGFTPGAQSGPGNLQIPLIEGVKGMAPESITAQIASGSPLLASSRSAEAPMSQPAPMAEAPVAQPTPAPAPTPAPMAAPAPAPQPVAAAPAAPPPTSAGTPGETATAPDLSGSGDGGGDSVLCTVAHDYGWMDDATYEYDTLFGNALRVLNPAVIAGYHVWSKPLARAARKHTALRVLLMPLVVAWGREMSFVMGTRERGSLIGRALMCIGLRVCSALGRRQPLSTL
jgi:hypothetical protein